MNNWSIYCLPRCGSTVAVQLLLQYFKQTDNRYNTYPIQTAKQTEWFSPPNIEIIAKRYGLTVDKARKQAYTTIQNLAGTEQFPLIKNIITAVPPYTYDFMKQCGYRVLIIHRRNIIDQYISHMVSVRSYYHIPTDIDLSGIKNRVEPFKATIDSFEAYYRHYMLLNTYKADAHIYYEDFINNYSVLFDTIGRPNAAVEYYASNLITQPIVGNLREYITNMDEVKQWFAHRLDFIEDINNGQ